MIRTSDLPNFKLSSALSYHIFHACVDIWYIIII